MIPSAKLKLLVLFSLMGALYLVHEKWYMAEGLHLEIEGLVKEPNYRDLGSSVNGCLETIGKKPVFLENGLHRSNKWFSGWSCDKVGNPDKIYTLNYEPDKNFSYYCNKADGTKVIGEIFSKKKEIKDIEFLSSWQDDVLKDVVCSTIDSIFDDVINGQSALFHCEAGRDRTGAVATLFTAMVMEHAELSPSTIDQVVECDYRKSQSIGENKFGRMKSFIKQIRESQVVSIEHPVSSWISKTCGFDNRKKLNAISKLRLAL